MDKPKVEGKPLPTIKRLRRVVGRILAERAQEGWRYRKKTGRSFYRDRMNMDDIRRALMDIYAPHGVDTMTVWSPANKFFTNGRIRSAIKFWEDKGKVNTRRQGRAGNGYKWVLTCDTKQWDRMKAKREKREAEREVEDAKRALEKEAAGKLAARIKELLVIDSDISYWSGGVSLNMEQAQEVIHHLEALDSFTLRRKD